MQASAEGAVDPPTQAARPLLDTDTDNMPTRGYVAGKPVSRWEADSDQIDIEYKNLDRPRPPHWCAECFSGPKGTLLKVLLLAVLFFLGLIIGYVIRRNVHETFIKPQLQKPAYGVQQDYNDSVRIELQERVTHIDNYNDSIYVLTEDVRISGLGDTNRLISYVTKFWKTYNFNSVKVKRYHVQLAYPRYEIGDESNQVIVQSDDKIVFRSHTNSSNVHVEYLPFNAYSHNGNVTGNLVYANYGREQDFMELEANRIEVNGTIVLVRYGATHAGNKVQRAEQRGAVGVILYSDPYDFTDGQPVTNASWWLPSWATQFSHVRYSLLGDPRTPNYPSFAEVPSVAHSEADYPRIPVTPINYGDAEELLRRLGGDVVPSAWKGGIPIPYHFGPGFTDAWNDSYVRLQVNNVMEIREIKNVIATINGKYEEDQYVIVGAHIDSWTGGAVDAGTGFAVLMELARTFSDQVHRGWRPRRTIIFAFWDASKFGHIGSYEWVQEYDKQLGASAVAYINLDAAIRGNHSFTAEASAQLQDVIFDATMHVQCYQDACPKGQSVFDVWRDRTLKPRPMLDRPGGDSDHAPFQYRIGVPVVSPAFTYDFNKYVHLKTYPAFSTLDDSPWYLKTFIDPDFKQHVMLTQVVADLILRLSDSALLPLSVESYRDFLETGMKRIQDEDYADYFKRAQLSLDVLASAVKNFTDAAAEFHRNYTSIDLSSITEFELHHKNNQVIQVSRAFIFEPGLPGKPQYRNVLMAPHSENLNQEDYFPGLMAGVMEGRRREDWNLLREQFGILLASLVKARDVLTEDMITASAFS